MSKCKRLPGLAVNCALVWRQATAAIFWTTSEALATGLDNAGYRWLGRPTFRQLKSSSAQLSPAHFPPACPWSKSLSSPRSARASSSYGSRVQRAHPDKFALVKPVNPDDPIAARSPLFRRVVVRYSNDSVRHIFGDRTGNGIADTILQALRANPSGLTRTQINNELFGGTCRLTRSQPPSWRC